MVTSGRDRSGDIGKRKRLKDAIRNASGEIGRTKYDSGEIGKDWERKGCDSGEIGRDLERKKNTIRERSGEIGRENALRNASGEIGREKRCDSFGKERSGEGGREQMFDSGEIGSD